MRRSSRRSVRSASGLVVIDEVHCVSMWGHDFRPDYLFIRRALDALGNPAVLGMTATATPATAAEIATALGRDLAVVRTSIVRPNLRYDVEQVTGNEDRLRILVERLRRIESGSAIVYARSRDSCERIARTLRGHGLAMEHYHAGLEAEERSRVQDDFVAGRIRGVVATTAFGMGIDKPDVRFVCLFNFPGLARELRADGRARRQRRSSQRDSAACEPLGCDGRAAIRDGRYPLPDDLRRVYRAVRDAGGTVGPEQLPAGDHDPRVLVGMLEQAGIVRRGYDAGRAMRIELLAVEAEPVRSSTTFSFATHARPRRGWSASSVSPRPTAAGTCRSPSTSARPFPGRVVPVTSAIRRSRARRPPQSTPLPTDVAGTIVRAVGGLTWPLGRRSLVAMLRGSVSAPPSARRAPAFGILEAASDAEVKRWLKALEAAGAIVEVESDDGYRLLHAVPGRRAPVARAEERRARRRLVVERLRSWRRQRSLEDGVPAYIVLHDATLRDLAAARPASLHELGGGEGLRADEDRTLRRRRARPRRCSG